MKVGHIAAAVVAAFFIVAAGPSPASDPPGNAPAVSDAPAPSADSTAVPSVPAGSAGHELTAADVEAWLNGLLPYGLKNGDLAGAVLQHHCARLLQLAGLVVIALALRVYGVCGACSSWKAPGCTGSATS